MSNSLFAILVASSLAACGTRVIKESEVQRRIETEIRSAAQSRPIPPTPDAVSQALLPPLTVELPPLTTPIETRFDLNVNNAPANQVFMALVSDTRNSMLVHPDVKETITVNLKDVTLPEALDAIREIYGYEYKIQGTRIYIQPVTVQTRLFQINYLAGRRAGRAEVRVSSGSIQAPPTGAPGAAPGAAAAPAAGAAPGTSAATSQSLESSRVTTTSDNDFWGDINSAIRTIIGTAADRNVVVNANSGIIMVRALPKELRAVAQYLKAMALMVERQVMLEAKIIEVALSDQYSAGINWGVFTTGPNSRFAAGVVNPGTTLRTDGTLQNADFAISPAASNPQTPDPLTGLAAAGSLTSRLTAAVVAPAAILGLAFQTSSFAALLNFLESQGTVHVLSSPRIATLNNQKAVIKVGTDEFFVTNVTTTTTAATVAGGAATVSPTITTQPFFSGIALDVTPQISADDQITLHIHPSVSVVTDKTKIVNLGVAGVITLPLASSSINESDTIVRVQDGTIAAIGGLMRQQQSNARSGLPGTTESPVGALAGTRNQQLTKSELVILLKVTIIRGDVAWQQQAQELNERMQSLRRPLAAEERK